MLAASEAEREKELELAKEHEAASEKGRPAPPAPPASSNVLVHEGLRVDLATGRECTPAEAAEADLLLTGATLGAADLVGQNGVRLAKVATATVEACEAALAKSPSASIALASMRPGELFACHTRQGPYAVFSLVRSVNGKPYSVELHVQHVTGAPAR